MFELDNSHLLPVKKKTRLKRIGPDPWHHKLLSRLGNRYSLVAVLLLLVVGWVVEMVYLNSRLNKNLHMVQNVKQLENSIQKRNSAKTSLLEEYNLLAEKPPVIYVPSGNRTLSPVAKLFGGDRPRSTQEFLASGRSLIKPSSFFTPILKKQSPFLVVSNIIQTPGTMPPLKLEDTEIKEPLEARNKEAVANLAGRISHDKTEVYLVSLKGQTYQMQAGEMVSGYRLVKDENNLLLVKAGEMVRVE